jgi:ribosomal-protein-serine acetyltransferase
MARVPLPDRIEGARLLLRRWVAGDAEALGHAITESLEHLRPWMPWIALEPRSVAERRGQFDEWANGDDGVYGVFVDGEVAGGCGLHRRIGADALEIGYWIRASHLRRGLATAVARLLTDAAFSIDGILGVEIHHDKANVASAGVPRALGFALVAERLDGPSAPGEAGIECIWRIDRGDWTGR